MRATWLVQHIFVWFVLAKAKEKTTTTTPVTSPNDCKNCFVLQDVSWGWQTGCQGLNNRPLMDTPEKCKDICCEENACQMWFWYDADASITDPDTGATTSRAKGCYTGVGNKCWSEQKFPPATSGQRISHGAVEVSSEQNGQKCKTMPTNFQLPPVGDIITSKDLGLGERCKMNCYSDSQCYAWQWSTELGCKHGPLKACVEKEAVSFVEKDEAIVGESFMRVCREPTWVEETIPNPKDRSTAMIVAVVVGCLVGVLCIGCIIAQVVRGKAREVDLRSNGGDESEYDEEEDEDESEAYE